MKELMLLEEHSFRKTKKGSTFLSGKAARESGTSIEFVLWNWDAAEANADPLENGKVYYFDGIDGEYNGVPQLTLNYSPVLHPEVDVSLYAKQFATVDQVEADWERFQMVMNRVADPFLQRLVREVTLSFNGAQLKQATGAKFVHHAGVGGWLAHTLEVYDFSIAIASSLPKAETEISLGLVQSGALVHDIGKLLTYDLGPPIAMTLTGMVEDHVALGIRLLQHSLDRLDPSTQDQQRAHLLFHIIASHHGRLDHGACVMPKFIEAYIVHHADKMSAEFECIRAASVPGEQLTSKIWALDNSEHLGVGETLKILV